MKLISVSICQENSVNWKKWKASKSRISGKNSGSRCSRQAFENRSAKRATALDSSFVKRRAKQAIGGCKGFISSQHEPKLGFCGSWIHGVKRRLINGEAAVWQERGSGVKSYLS
uniref:Uncharacterized protein n=1 Tax=Vespula pensylvanica TaxID=30213 RepID=A0A834U475_VESPE|nr:hypothetical protein H0235_012283 [Vespula pensylvanica]